MKELRVRDKDGTMRITCTGQPAFYFFAMLQGFIRPVKAAKPGITAYRMTEDVLTGEDSPMRIWLYKDDQVICEA